METKKITSREFYTAPECIVIDALPEGMLCLSGEGEIEGLGDDFEFNWDDESMNIY
ncbi:MAG: hypothetical protein ACI395_03525 [Candidatus Cryptobacteroides sp.]